MGKRGNKETQKIYPLESGKYLFWLSWAVIAIVYVLIRINIIDVPLNRDEGIFGYAGQEILRGGLPYKDFFDIKPPVVFYINALALLFVPSTSVGLHIFLHVYNFITLITLFFVGKTFCKSNSAGLWVAFIFGVFSSLPIIEGFSASTEMFMLLPVSLSLLFTILTVQTGRWYLPMLGGICAGIAFWTKASGALIMMFVFIYLITAQLHRPFKENTDIGRIIKLAFLWCAGFILFTSIIVGYFYIRGVFDEFIYWSFTHTFIYAKRRDFNSYVYIYDTLVLIIRSNWPVILLGLLVCIYEVIKKNRKAFFPLGFLLFSVLSTLPGYAYPHYFAQLAPAVGVIGGMGFFFLVERLRRKATRTIISLLFALSVVGTPLIAHSDYYITFTPEKISRAYFGINPFTEAVDIADYISKNTDKNDKVFIFGAEPEIFYYTRLKSATSFAQIYPLMYVHSRYQEFQKKAFKEIEAAGPKYIISFAPLITSILYDGVADLWIQREVNILLEKDYYPEAVMTMEYPKGKLILLTEENKSRLDTSGVLIVIYKRKTN